MKIKIEVSALADLKEDLRRAEEMVDYLAEHLRAYADAAEFEGRVSARMAQDHGLIKGCPPGKCMNDCAAHWLKDARIAVEEEMDK